MTIWDMSPSFNVDFKETVELYKAFQDSFVGKMILFIVSS